MTGSRIKRRDMETTGPITIIDAVAISASGALSIDSLLQQLTVTITNLGINNGSGGNSRVNLRGLGEEHTLVLLNGLQMIASGTGAAASIDNYSAIIIILAV